MVVAGTAAVVLLGSAVAAGAQTEVTPAGLTSRLPATLEYVDTSNYNFIPPVRVLDCYRNGNEMLHAPYLQPAKQPITKERMLLPSSLKPMPLGSVNATLAAPL